MAPPGEQLEIIDGLEHGYCARPGEVDLRLMGSPGAVLEARRLVEKSFEQELVSDDGAVLEEVVVHEGPDQADAALFAALARAAEQRMGIHDGGPGGHAAVRSSSRGSEAAHR